MNTRDSDSSDNNIQLYLHIAVERTHGGYERVTPGLNRGRRGGTEDEERTDQTTRGGQRTCHRTSADLSIN